MGFSTVLVCLSSALQHNIVSDDKYLHCKCACVAPGKWFILTLFQKRNLLLHREQEWAIITVRFTRSSVVLLQVKSLRSLFVALMFTRPARCDLAIVYDTWGGHRVAATLRWNIITCLPLVSFKEGTLKLPTPEIEKGVMSWAKGPLALFGYAIACMQFFVWGSGVFLCNSCLVFSPLMANFYTLHMIWTKQAQLIHRMINCLV